MPDGRRRRFWQHQNRPKWCRFIPALTSGAIVWVSDDPGFTDFRLHCAVRRDLAHRAEQMSATGVSRQVGGPGPGANAKRWPTCRE